MKKKIGYSMAIATIVLLIVGSFLLSIYMISMDRAFFTQQYKKNNTEIDTQMSLQDLERATNKLLDYLSDKTDNLDISAVVNGEEREVFDKREKDHMIDVKDLFLLLRNIIIAAFIGVGVLVVVGIYFYKLDFIHIISKLFFKTATFFLAIATVLGIMIVVNFNWFWTKFHEVFFTNDLWMLDPEISVMINMFPLQFFFACCTRIIILFVIFMVIFSGMALLERKLKKTERI